MREALLSTVFQRASLYRSVVIKLVIILKLQFLESSNIYINNILGGIWQQGTGWGQKQLTKIFPDSTLNFLILLRNAKIICFRNDCFPFSSAISIQIYSQLNVRLRCIFGIKWSNIKEILQVMEKNLRSEAWWPFISLHFSLITHYTICWMDLFDFQWKGATARNWRGLWWCLWWVWGGQWYKFRFWFWFYRRRGWQAINILRDTFKLKYFILCILPGCRGHLFSL